MLLIACPHCGERPEIEFSYGGQAHLVRPRHPSQLDDQAWAEFLYMRSNTKGVYAERWRHARGCGRFFNALRDTATDHFLAFYKTGETPPSLASPLASRGEPTAPCEPRAPSEPSAPGGPTISGKPT